MWYVLVFGQIGFYVFFRVRWPYTVVWKEMAQLLRKKRGIIFQLIWQTGRRERPPTPTTNGQGNNKNISSPSLLFPYSGVGNLLCPKKSEKLFKGSPVITDEKPLSFSSVPRTKTFQKYEEIKIPPLFLREINELPLLPKFLFRSSSSAAAADVQNICFIAFRPRFTFFFLFSGKRTDANCFHFWYLSFVFQKLFDRCRRLFCLSLSVAIFLSGK